MKELYMTVSPDSPLYRDYFMWLSDYKKVKEIYGEIREKYGIESLQVYPYDNKFMIVPTQTDKEKFKKFLLKDGKTFRKNCEISKVWIQSVKGIKFIKKPAPAFYFAEWIGNTTSRLFAVGDVLYCSINAEHELNKIPSWANVMKASEFYKVMEDME